MTDVELDNFRYTGDGRYIFVVQPVPAVHLESQAMGKGDRGLNLLKLLLTASSGVAIAARMDLDTVGPGLSACLDLTLLWIDEESDKDPLSLKTAHSLLNLAPVSDHIEAPFCSQLLTTLRNKTDVVGPDPFSLLHHFRGHGHLQV